MTDQVDISELYELAHTFGGRPLNDYLVPHRNIRDVLSLHAKTSPQKTFLVYHDDEGNRSEITYVEFTARVHQVANFMFEDLDIQRGDRIALLASNSVDVALIYLAAWIVGAAVIPIDPRIDDKLAHVCIHQSGAEFIFTSVEHLARIERIAESIDSVHGIIQLDGDESEGAIHFLEAVKNRPTTFLGDDSGAKSADLSIISGNEKTATLDDDAVVVFAGGDENSQGIVLTQYNLLVTAWGLSQSQAFTGNQRLMGIEPLGSLHGIIYSLIMPMLVGGSSVVNQSVQPDHFWERIIRDKVNIAGINIAFLQQLLEFASQQETAGNTIFGHNINRRNLTKFRHFILTGKDLEAQLARGFEERFGFPLIYTFGWEEGAGYSCILPTQLSWQEHQQWLCNQDVPSIGCVLEGNDVTVLATDGMALEEGEIGEICIRGHNVMKQYLSGDIMDAETFRYGWFHTNNSGYFRLDEQGRKFFFVTSVLREAE